VIGNPPWIFTKYVDWGEPTKAYITANYLQTQQSAARGKARQSGKINLFAIFTLQGINLLRNGGLFSFILPNNILRTTVYDTTRKRILQTTRVKTVVDLKAGVFPRVTAATVILVLEKGYPNIDTMTKIIDSKTKGEISEQNTHEVKQGTFLENTSYAFNIFARHEDLRICEQIRSRAVPLGNLAWEIIEGIVTNKGKEKYITTEPKGPKYKK
jgi:type I restriction-modification system DNA methylase subunit